MKKVLIVALFSLFLAGCCDFFGPYPPDDENTLDQPYTPPVIPLNPNADFQAECWTMNELNPAFVRFTTQKGIPLVDCIIQNDNAGDTTYLVTAEVKGWSEPISETVSLKAGEARYVSLTPVFQDKFYSGKNLEGATITYKVEKSGLKLYEHNQQVNVTPASQFVFGTMLQNGSIFYTPFLAAMWVTPDDPCIESVIAVAKEKMPGRSFSDYQGYAQYTEEQKALATMQQMKAVYETIQGHGISYVNSVVTFGDPANFKQNVRFPYESLETKNANCIDGAVLYASVFEKIGLEPIIVVVPGHAFVGVRNDRNSSDVTMLETTMTGTNSFEEAVAAAMDTYEKNVQQQAAIPIDVTVARDLGVTPFPLSRTTCGVKVEQNLPTTPNPYLPYPTPQPAANCADGTLNFQCSRVNQPAACVSGILIPDCFDCGCPYGTVCGMDGNCYAWGY